MNKMKLWSLCLLSMLVVGCKHATLEDKAEQDAVEYTRRFCPTPDDGFQRTDSVTFNRDSRTFNYYYTFVKKADDEKLIQQLRPKLITTLKKNLRDNTQQKVYKDAGYKFRFIYRSESTGKVLLDQTITAK